MVGVGKNGVAFEASVAKADSVCKGTTTCNLGRIDSKPSLGTPEEAACIIAESAGPIVLSTVLMKSDRAPITALTYLVRWPGRGRG